MHLDRNICRSLPCRPFASACLEHSIDLAVRGFSGGFAVGVVLLAAGGFAGGVCAITTFAERRLMIATTVTIRIRRPPCVCPTLRAIPDIVDARNPAASNVSFPAGVSVVLRIRFRVVLRVLLPRIRFRVVLRVLLPRIRFRIVLRVLLPRIRPCIVFLVLPGLRLAVSPGVAHMCRVGMSTSTQQVADSTSSQRASGDPRGGSHCLLQEPPRSRWCRGRLLRWALAL